MSPISALIMTLRARSPICTPLQPFDGVPLELLRPFQLLFDYLRAQFQISDATQPWIFSYTTTPPTTVLKPGIHTKVCAGSCPPRPMILSTRPSTTRLSPASAFGPINLLTSFSTSQLPPFPRTDLAIRRIEYPLIIGDLDLAGGLLIQSFPQWLVDSVRFQIGFGALGGHGVGAK